MNHNEFVRYAKKLIKTMPINFEGGSEKYWAARRNLQKEITKRFDRNRAETNELYYLRHRIEEQLL